MPDPISTFKQPSQRSASAPLKLIGRHPKFDIKVPDAEFISSRRWLELRYHALKLHGARCQCCGADRRTTVIQVDHIKSRENYPELQWDIENLQVLCRECNVGKGACDKTDWR